MGRDTLLETCTVEYGANGRPSQSKIIRSSLRIKCADDPAGFVWCFSEQHRPLNVSEDSSVGGSHVMLHSFYRRNDQLVCRTLRWEMVLLSTICLVSHMLDPGVQATSSRTTRCGQGFERGHLRTLYNGRSHYYVMGRAVRELGRIVGYYFMQQLEIIIFRSWALMERF